MSENKRPNPPKNNKPNLKPKFNFYWIYGLIAVMILSFHFMTSSASGNRNLSQNKFNEILIQGDVEEINILKNKGYALVKIKDESKSKDAFKDYKTESFIPGPQALILEYTYGSLEQFEKSLDLAKENNPELQDVVIRNEMQSSDFTDILIGILPWVLILGVWIYVMRRMAGGGSGGGGGQIFSIGKSKAKLFDQDQKVKTTFKDVAGLEGAKEEVQEIVDFLKRPEKYTQLGGKIPKGALLVGPPGTGKTLLAKAVAGEAGVPFFSLSGSDFVEMFVGVGASRVRDLFKQAQQKSPSIIFIDEIDAIGRARGKNNMTGGNDERENTLNQLLTEMDGFGSDTNVIVMAATNRADVLDKALLRPGRFDRQIYVDLPDLVERKAIFQVHMKNLKLGEDVDVEFLSQQTPGFSGADIANLCNESALIAARKGKKRIQKQDFLDAVDRIVGGLEKKNKIISPKEKKTIAFHEAGHATASWMLEYAAPLVKVTIVPRGQSLGAAWYLPAERAIVQTEQMLDEMCATLAGRAAEQIVFGKISTGALSDLEKVTKQARAMVTVYGLNEKIGNLTYYDSSGQNEYGFSKPYSETTAQAIDEEISKIIEEQYQRAINILSEHKDKLTALAEQLLEKEVIFKEDLVKIFGERPFEEEQKQEEKEEAKEVSKAEAEMEKEDLKIESEIKSDDKSEEKKD